MFYYISGKLAALEPAFAVIDAGGVGYKMTISQNTYSAMPPHRSVTEMPMVRLYSYMAVREDDVELFGFISQEELSAFKMLITVSGVGPKAAISVLSQLSPAKLAVAICTDDKKAIAQSNGIGPKTAARIILELKDKLKNTVIDDFDESDTTAVSVASGSKLSDAQDALAVLGYSKNEALSALRGIDLNSLELDEIIKLALKKLMR
ncbi:MAG: Holliday junction branch migration protein RuvA [Ruminococcaceae bacterium]|nr:Holliday junction branch migration protein RuvA [Oscillospiraceae bacterium]